MSEETLLSVEEPRTRAEIAAQLRSLADGLADGGPLTVAAGDQVVTVTPPDRPEFELEVEREYAEDGEGNDDGEHAGEISIEVEIEWDETDTDSDSSTGVAIDGETDTDAPIEPAGEAIPAAASDDGETVVSQGQFQLYVDRAGKWRWRLVHRNGNIIAASGQGYASRQKAEQGMASVMRNAPDAEAIAVE